MNYKRLSRVKPVIDSRHDDEGSVYMQTDALLDRLEFEVDGVVSAEVSSSDTANFIEITCVCKSDEAAEHAIKEIKEFTDDYNWSVTKSGSTLLLKKGWV